MVDQKFRENSIVNEIRKLKSDRYSCEAIHELTFYGLGGKVTRIDQNSAVEACIEGLVKGRFQTRVMITSDGYFGAQTRAKSWSDWEDWKEVDLSDINQYLQRAGFELRVHP